METHRRRAAIWLLVLSAAAVATAAYFLFGVGTSGGDIDVYRAGGGAVLHGESLYDERSSTNLRFTYTPFVAILFVPLALIPSVAAAVVWALVSFAALAGSVWVLLGAIGVRCRGRRAWLTALGVLAALPLAPVTTHFWAGQINLALLLLVVADLLARRPHGVGVGIAAGIKLTPLIFVPYLLFSGRVRAAATATGTFLGTILVGLLVLPDDSRRYWLDALFDLDRVVPDDGAWLFGGSVRGTLERTVESPVTPWLVLAAVIGGAGLLVAVTASRRGHELVGVVLCSVTGLLISPVSWPWHWVWCVPLLVLWADRAWRRDLRWEKYGVVVLWLSFTAMSWWALSVLFGVPRPTVVDEVFANLFVVVGVVTVAVVAGSAYSAAARTRG